MIIDLTHPPSLGEVCDRALKLPSSPVLLPQLMASLHQMEGTAGEIERIIRLDSALAAATLRHGNSASYGLREPIESIEQAIIMLGYREIYRLASMSLMNRWETVHHVTLPWEPGAYSRHCFCTALAAEVIAEARDNGDPQVAYTAGLVCDLGKLALAYTCAEYYPRISAYARRMDCTWSEAEKSVLGFDQTEVGARLLRAWRFPENLARAVELQDNPAEAPPELLPLVSQLHAARFLAVSLGPGVTEGGFLFTLHGDFLTEQRFTSDFLEETMVEVRERALHRLGDRLSYGVPKA